MDLTVLNLAASVGAITLGAILQASTGMGAGLVIVPLLALISLDLVPGPLIFASLVLSFLMAWRGRNTIEFANMPMLLIGLTAGMAAGAMSISAIPIAQVGLLFGVFILLAVLVSIKVPRISFSTGNLLGVGALSGFMGTTAAIGAPVLALLYQHEQGETLRATLGFLYFVSSITMLFFLNLAGRFGADDLLLGFYLIPGFVLGYLLSGTIAGFLDRGYSRAAILIISSISAALLIFRSL